MKIVISPAKSLNFEKKLPANFNSEPVFLKEAQEINKILKEKTPTDLSDLMNISDKLAELNWKRNQDWKTPFKMPEARQAIYAFDGDVYLGLDAYSIEQTKISKLQSSLRILSGLYGILKPFDLILPYRLEMGTSLSINESKNLYAFWQDKITENLNKDLKNSELFVNLASNEYFSVINTKKIKSKIITPEFRDYKNGQLKVISFFAKKARGMMARYIIDNNVESISNLKMFNGGGYQFDSNLSNENKLVFTR